MLISAVCCLFFWQHVSCDAFLIRHPGNGPCNVTEYRKHQTALIHLDVAALLPCCGLGLCLQQCSGHHALMHAPSSTCQHAATFYMCHIWNTFKSVKARRFLSSSEYGPPEWQACRASWKPLHLLLLAVAVARMWACHYGGTVVETGLQRTGSG